MPSNQTPNYQLSQWEKSDKVLMEDFNADNAKIDAALKAEADTRASAVSALAVQMGRKGDCRVRIHSYVGTGISGSDHPTVINFTGHPDFFIIHGGQGVMFGTYGQEATLFYTDRSLHSMLVPPDWSGNRFSFYVGGSTNGYPQLNISGKVYQVIEFYVLF